MCTGGFICRKAAFSGLPILTPIDVENLLRIMIPEWFDIILGTVSELSSLIGFLKSKLKRIFASVFFSVIESSKTSCGIQSFSRVGLHVFG